MTTDQPNFFGTQEYAGVRIIEFEEEGYGAPGHVDPPRMVEAIRAYVAHTAAAWGNDAAFVALAVEDTPAAVEDVEHVWVTFDGGDERVTWDGVTADTPGAFPMTTVLQ